MTASELAFKVGAKKQGKEWVTICPAHPDRKPSLAIGIGKKVPIVLNCRSHGCHTSDILKAWGMTYESLFHGKPTAEVRISLTQRQVRAALEKQLDLVIVLGAIDGKPAYWNVAEKRIRGDISQLRCALEPEQIYREYRDRMFQQRVKKYGWDSLWRGIKQ
jgi:hypothetical protein